MADAADTRDRDASTPSPPPPPRLEALGGGRLLTPVTRKADSIASQFQREILGELNASKTTTQLRMDVSVGGAGVASYVVRWYTNVLVVVCMMLILWRFALIDGQLMKARQRVMTSRSAPPRRSRRRLPMLLLM